MEEVLKSRSLSSATARRNKIRAREEERRVARTERDSRRRMLVQTESSDDETQSNSEDDTRASLHSRQDSYDETSSEYSLKTPDDTPHPIHEKTPSLAGVMKPTLQIAVPKIPSNIKQHTSVPSGSSPPKLQASLVKRSDFNYDRYSMLIDTPMETKVPSIPFTASPVQITKSPDTEGIDSDEEDDEDDEVEIVQAQLCKVATPVSFSAPKARPAVISISSRESLQKRRASSSTASLLHQATTRSSSMIPPELPQRSTRRLSQTSSKSGFLASEASPFQMPPDLPHNAMYMIANASRDSVALSTHSAAEPLSRPQQSRKSSMPLLTAAFKSHHSRLSSFRGLMSPPQSARSDSISETRPKTAVANPSDLSFQTVPTNLNDPLPLPTSGHSQRPSTSYANTMRTGSVTALPTPPPDAPTTNPMETARESSPSPEGHMRRKKSFSALRKRSESISKAISFVAGAKKGSRDSRLPPPTPVVPPLPMSARSQPATPAMSHGGSRKSTDLQHNLTMNTPPPLPSPREQMRKSVTNANYSPFPAVSARQSGRGIIGLGIRT
jgi:hypothetical protein